MNLEVNYLVNNDCYKQNKKITPQGIVVHSVGCAQPDRHVFVKNWNVGGLEKCVNAFVDDQGITQTLPWDTRPWGCGKGSKGSYNNSHIQFEMCEPAGHKYNGGTMLNYNIEKNQEYFNKIYNNAVELCVYLCKLYNLKASSIVCHSEAYKLGYGSNHSDVMQWFPKHNKNMDIFRSDVDNLLKKDSNDSASENNNNNTNEDINNSKDNIDYLFKVKITDPELNIRKGPGVSYEVVGVISDFGTYRITETKGDWGKLYSGAGWINLKYTTYTDNNNNTNINEDNKNNDYIYKVKVKTDLNIRSGPGTSYKVVGVIRDNGVYRIVEEKGSWGKLYSGQGWISLNYVNKL